MVYDIYFENKYNNKHKTLLYLNNRQIYFTYHTLLP